MVLQQTHPVSRKAQATRLDFNRILGISSTLALNVLALLFLLTPMTLPSLQVVVEKPPGLVVVDIVPVDPPTPPPPEVEIVPPRPQTPPTIRESIIQPRAVDVPVLVEDGTAFAEAAVEPAITGDPAPSIEPATPRAGMQLQYETAPPPDYPRAAIRGNLEGTVLLRILVGIDGRPIEVSIEKSSGHSVLDREAQRHVQRRWIFRPAMRDGRPVQAVGVVPIDFRLGRG